MSIRGSSTHWHIRRANNIICDKTNIITGLNHSTSARLKTEKNVIKGN